MTPPPSQGRTDPVDRKMALLNEALRAGEVDRALSLAESIKDTVQLAKIERGEPGAVASDVGDFAKVADLPAPWAAWARGWSIVKPISLFETVGIERTAEPTTVRLALAPDHATDPQRELRVARVETDGSLREVISQVEGVTRDAKGWRCRVLLQAEVPAHGRATYLIFLGNHDAERPAYVTDLKVDGEGYGLDITNHHYVARLSRQVGQLERLTSRREHGLELYAGGKGHGEPPCIDWAHDYVDEGNFQKLRLRNWAECPNYEVERGPLAVRVRRWGFPHSPLHPLFTPSRIHIDQEYTFFAGLPYFVKQGRFDVLQDVTIEASRDDEWVFSGYSFDRELWFDAAGKLHEGPVPPEHADKLWGVGFRNTTSRDAFMALWLEHVGEGHEIGHNGSPTLQYDGHGQLWSRYPAQKTTLKRGTVLRQRNAYQLFGYPKEGGAAELEQLRHRLLHPVEIAATEVPRPGNAVASGSLARPGEAGEAAAIKAAIWNAMRQVRDEQLYAIDANVVDLGLIYDVQVRLGTAHITMTMPHRGRPVYDFFVTRGGGRVEEGIQERVAKLDGIRDVVVEMTWNPPWTPHRITDRGRETLGIGWA